jgi:hypothetical protein
MGERVRFVTSFFKNTPADNPTGEMAVFESLDRRDQSRYAATQKYFVTLDCWEGLRRHFGRRRSGLPDRESPDDAARSHRPEA